MSGYSVSIDGICPKTLKLLEEFNRNIDLDKLLEDYIKEIMVKK